MHTLLDCQIRWMIRRDARCVQRIEELSFPIPWTKEDFECALRNRQTIGMVAESHERIIGYMVYELHRQHLRVVNFAVHPDFRRQSVGRQMIEKLIRLATKQTHITLEVRETNLDAQFFFSRLGFVATEVLRGAYLDTPEDAYVMKFNLTMDDYHDPVST